LQEITCVEQQARLIYGLGVFDLQRRSRQTATGKKVVVVVVKCKGMGMQISGLQDAKHGALLLS
jgi:hypothetical protein